MLLLIPFLFFEEDVFAQEKEEKDTIVNVNKMAEIPQSIRRLAEALDKAKEQKVNEEPLIEIDGLVVNETRTKMGRDFYDEFYNNWVPPPNARNYTITIEELPYIGYNTQILVYINDNLIFQSLLMPRFDYIEDLVADLNSRALQYLQYYEEILQSLENEDMSGTGIY